MFKIYDINLEIKQMKAGKLTYDFFSFYTNS